MARLSEIAKAIEDDMQTNGAQLSEIARAQGQLKLTIELEVKWFDPAMYAHMNKHRKELLSR